MLYNEGRSYQNISTRWSLEIVGGTHQSGLGMGCSAIEGGLYALGILTEDRVPPRKHIRAKGQTVDYFMVNASRIGFGLVLWCQNKLVL